jgi:hypothetical protein
MMARPVIDRTVHSYLHVAKPLALSMVEMQASTGALIEGGMIEADPGYDRLIRLTPVGAAVCRFTHVMKTRQMGVCRSGCGARG